MRPETAVFLSYGRTMVERGRAMVGISLYDDAGRAAYMAAFHAAQALIFERAGKVVKTHRGVRTEFHRLTMTEGGVTNELRSFLGGAYELKTVADYDPSGHLLTNAPEATDVLDRAARFIDGVEAMVNNPPAP